MKKRIMSLLLVGAMVVACVGCGKANGELMADAATRIFSETDKDNVFIDDEAIALAASVVNADMSEAEKKAAADMRAVAKAALDQCNTQRANAGLKALTWHDGLESCAMVRAQEAVGTWSHTRPNGTDWWTVNSSLMYGENLAKGYTTAGEAVAAWMASPTHKENIMFADFRTCGIAIYETGGMWYWAEEFGY